MHYLKKFGIHNTDNFLTTFLLTVSSGGGSSRRSPVPVVEGSFSTTLELPTKPLTSQEKATRKKREMREKVNLKVFTLLQDIIRQVIGLWRKTNAKSFLDQLNTICIYYNEADLNKSVILLPRLHRDQNNQDTLMSVSLLVIVRWLVCYWV